MEFLKKLLPISFKATDKDNFTKALVIYIVAIVAMTVLGILLGWIPVLSTLISLAGYLVDLYATGGIVVAILVFTKVIKD